MLIKFLQAKVNLVVLNVFCFIAAYIEMNQ